MNADKASTLRLLREGIGNEVTVLESREGNLHHEVRAYLPKVSESSMIPILFLLTTLAFLEAKPEDDNDARPEGRCDAKPEEFTMECELVNSEYMEVDGWTPADFLSHLRFEDRKLSVNLTRVRGRLVHTSITLTASGELVIATQGRGRSAARWLSHVQGRMYLQEVSTSRL